MSNARRLLNIQSHVVSGHVGGQAGAFPLALLGWDVSFVPTVLFSNHPAYGAFAGTRTDPALLEKLLQGLDQNGLAQFDRLLTGYVPSPEAAHIIALYIERHKAANPGLVYILDPVLGESGRFYVDEKLAPLYRQLAGVASIITPNQFEAEVLSGTKITDAASLQDVLKVLHTGLGTPHVVITSVDLPAGAIAPTDDEQSTHILVGSSYTQGRLKPWIIKTPSVPGHYSGTGDLLAALIAGKFTAGADEAQALQNATEYAVSALHTVLTTTHQHALAEASQQPQSDIMQVASVYNDEPTTLSQKSINAAQTELRIIESRAAFDVQGPPKFTAIPV